MQSQVLEKLTRQFYTHLDLGEHAAAVAMLTDDVQLVNEVSRAWIRGRGAVEEYLHAVDAKLADLQTSLSDVSPTDLGQFGLVTGMAHQEYRYQGEQVWFTAPLTVGFVQAGGEWRIALLHSIPLPEVTA